MTKSKTEASPKIFLKEMKKKFADSGTLVSTSSVFAGEKHGKQSGKIANPNAQRDKAKKNTHLSDAKLDRCALCNGRLEEGTTEFMARAGGEVVIINDVPAFVCEQCGEAYYSVETSRKIDAVMNEAHKKKLCVRPVPAGEVSLNS
jgi:YgiT-type zinc finger domain-containing protein